MPSKKRSPGRGGRKRLRSMQEQELLDAVLGKEDYRSSDDEDYAPDQHASARAGGEQPPSTPTRSASAAAAAGGDSGGGDEETPLSERKRQLLLQRQRQAGPPELPPAGSAHHLPVDVIGRILMLACARNAVPTVAAGTSPAPCHFFVSALYAAHKTTNLQPAASPRTLQSCSVLHD